MCLAFYFSERRPCWLFSSMQTRLIPINFTYQFGTDVDFIDSSLSIRGDSISSDLYTKPTDTHQYLLHWAGASSVWADPIRGSLWLLQASRGGTAWQCSCDTERPCPQLHEASFGNQPHRPGLHLEHSVAGGWELLRDSFPILQSNEHLGSIFDFPLVSYTVWEIPRSRYTHVTGRRPPSVVVFACYFEGLRSG